MTGRATEALLDQLHGLVAGELKAAIEAARKPDADGNPGVVPASLLLAAMKFLKENGIDAPAKSERLSDLAGQLRDLDLEEEARNRVN